MQSPRENFSRTKNTLNSSGSNLCPSVLRVLGAWLLFGIVRGLAAVPSLQSGVPPLQSYDGKELGVDAATFTATQDAEGVLYVGGKTVLRFDGATWQSLPVPGAFTVRGLEFGTDGRLWVAAFGELGWFERTANRAWQFHSLRPHLPADLGPLGELWHVFAEPGGRATFVSDNRILRWDGARFRIWALPGERRLPAFRIGGAIHVHHLPTGLHALRGDQLEPVIAAEVLGTAAVLWVEARSDGWLLGTSEGLFRYAGERLTPYAPEFSAHIKPLRPTSFVRLADGRLAAGTFNGGVAVLDQQGQFAEVVTEKEGLPSRIVRSMYGDRDGLLWIMSQSTVSRVDLVGSTRLYDRRSGLPEQPYHSITGYGDRIAVAGDTGIFELPRPGVRFARLPRGGEFAHQVRGTDDGLVISATRSLVRVQRDQVETLHHTVHDIYGTESSRENADEMLVFEHQSILAKDRRGGTRILVQDLPDNARRAETDADGMLWIELTFAGVMLARPGSDGPVNAFSPPTEYGLPAETGKAFVRSTPEGGIVVFGERGAWAKPPGQRRFRPVENWPAREVAAVSAFGPGATAWTVHPATAQYAATAGQVAFSGATAQWTAHEISGLAAIGTPRSLWVESNPQPELWIGGTRSVLRHVVVAGPSTPPPATPLLHVSAVPDRVSSLQPVTAPLPYSTRAVHFDFTSPQFARSQAVRMETRIVGIDADWVAAGPHGQRELSALRDGTYRFEVRAVAGSGAASAPAYFDFEVLPPWWRSGPAIAVALLLLGPLGYFVSRLRSQALQRRTLELEAKVRQRTEELVAANAAKTEFVANMSHDIRNPLNGIVGLALALEDSRLEPRQREMVATLRECTTYLSSLVDDVLDFASIEAGRLELRSGPFAPTELLRSIVETLRANATEAGAVLSVEASPDLPPHLQGDAGRIQQILVNFVSNALKYAGGHIRLCAQVPADAPEEVEFAVQDNGPGIASQDHAVLFTKFTRLQKSHGGEAIPGTGLGLAACRLLADAMGGSVGVTSRPGHGARFFLRLPRVAAPAPLVAPPAQLPDSTVLLVEDTDYNAVAATAVLARLGLGCKRARTGEEALQLFAARRFTLVLLDRNLPDMDGTEVARRMRETEADGSRAILLAVTAYCTAEDRQLCLQAGMDAFVGKPLTPEKLRRVLGEVSRRVVATSAPLHVAPDPVTAAPDLKLLAYLGTGTAESLEEQTRRFLVELEDLQERLQQASADSAFSTLAELAHRMLGLARMVAGADLADASSRLEVAARSRDAAGCHEWLTRLNDAVSALRAAILARSPAAPEA
ncbi:MAG: response regulator [Opitutaceae bacterium]|nr:response regulator [Opitutaceae bacterium]